MKKIILNKFSQEVIAHYHYFKNKIGSEEIAKPVTLQVLLYESKRLQPKRILEIGGGIGTISSLLLKHTNAFIDIYEDNEFCIKTLHKILKQFKNRFTIIDSYDILPPSREYDLMIIDGADKEVKHGAGSKTVWLFIHYLTSIKVIYIEGDRHIQRLLVRKALSTRYTYTLYDYGDVLFEGKLLRGGIEIVCKPQTLKLIKLVNFLYWEIRVGKTIKNFFRYRCKIFLNKMY